MLHLQNLVSGTLQVGIVLFFPTWLNVQSGGGKTQIASQKCFVLFLVAHKAYKKTILAALLQLQASF